jgi:hypothetical protein
MKIRNGFVSNSSSSSFVISKHFISAHQLEQIRNHSKLGEEMGIPWTDYPWDITENEHEVEGYTSMNNFDMDEFLKRIGVKEEHIHMHRY